jgi:hypothetical protein
VASSRGIYYRGRICCRIGHIGDDRAGRNAREAVTVDRMKVHLTAHHGQLRYVVCISMLERSFSLVMPKLGYLRLRHQFNLF